ncbi:PAS domain-containing sensor histidine kinase [Haematospirillum jordaniae]|uniref:Nitrogen regulation protein n=1 Tax=Haematospirillum jordaniae TaxID=1549855 RepID=A0A143DEK4_9PROT|nr:PAS domain-containing sensor histidine kinase [Haematospirillum jordaniae]AMW35171.1 PAS domain-containing sensor histidine kinase [Haematospirillum jordaniae]NKD46153.1 PAS domain-containing sensor histidine kinase [Haematospirillum jordaniae]NKD56435.1 PAS domain-containing sensor histidine kinase [Haematospirillum jordaniae]NKD58493.1 PAS domain-containing sensor histidine kinase [Haematospirillum jordaniae]NKD66338.1 PAS domain-containing sensor histidine kinase [Haematospirillum jordan
MNQPVQDGSVMRFYAWLRQGGVARKLAVLLGAAALVFGAATWAVLAGFWEPVSDGGHALSVLLNLDLILLLVLSALVIRSIVALWLARRTGGAGSRLHLRLVGLFGAVAITPTILVAVFSALFFNLGVQFWFGERVQTVLSESQAVAQAYLDEHRQAIAGQALVVAGDIQRNWERLLQNPDDQSRYLQTQVYVRGLTEAVLFERSGKVGARAGYTFSLQFEDVPLWALEKADQGEVAVLTGENEDRVRALVRLDTLPEMFLYVGRFVDTDVIRHIDNTDNAVQQYQRMQSGRAELELRFSLVFIVVSLLLLLAAVWVGLNLANRWAMPIVELINASERVSVGDMAVRVSEVDASDEVAALSRAFNRMTARITAQQKELLEANRTLDERKRFTETVLEGVSAGVISTSPDGFVTLVNRSAQTLLDLPAVSSLEGQHISIVIPEFSPLLPEKETLCEGQSAQREMVLSRGGKDLTFLVRVSAEYVDSRVIGNVITFDDITLLQAAQRTAAWADIARRIAHEIKNPLTPIQLSAERLKRRYLKQIQEGQDVFVQCTDTIIRHVGDIGQMVDEFSAFARMPQPVMKNENLCEIIRQYSFLQQTAYPAIRFVLDIPEEEVVVLCDTRQVGQALTNIIKNAVEAIESRDNPTDPGCITVSLREQGGVIRVLVSDNGRGLPKANRERLVEPYVTTRSKGTGLGLAIVKKILEDHGGDLLLEDASDGGAQISMLFTFQSAVVQDGVSA